MSCTEENPCRMPILRWVHSETCKKLSEPVRLPTFRKKHDEIIAQAVKDGWTAGDPNLKVRWVEIYRNGRCCRLWFKPEAIYIGETSNYKRARSLISDPRQHEAGKVLATALEAFEKWHF